MNRNQYYSKKKKFHNYCPTKYCRSDGDIQQAVDKWDSNPIEAFDICSQQTCPLFYQGKLHKCSSVGMLDRMLEDHNQTDDPAWAPYLNAGWTVPQVGALSCQLRAELSLSAAV